MSDENDANKFIKAVLKFDPTMTYKAVMKDGRTFKSKGYDNAEVEFNKRQPSKSNYKIKIT